MPRKCVIEDCDRPLLARGWCTRHYQRWRATGDPLGNGDKSVSNRHEVLDGTTGVLVITSPRGGEHRCLYDLADHDLVAQHQWFLSYGYVVRNRKGGRSARGIVHLHRAVLGIPRLDPRRVDHISGNRMDDRRANLRVVDAGINGENRAVINEVGTSQYRGVCWDKSRGRWKAYTRIKGRMCNVGYYVTEEEAAAAIAAYRAQRGIEPGYPRRHPEMPVKR